MHTAIIYDCDGVLLDTEVLYVAVELEQLAAVGFRPDRDDYLRRYVGLDPDTWRRRLTADVEAATGATLPSAFFEDLDAASRTALEGGLAVVPGVHAAVTRIPGARCVASSTPLPRLSWKLRRTGLAAAFDLVFSADMVERGKPAPDLFLHAADVMAATPAECVVVEDSVNGVRAGVAADMRVVGFTGGGHCGPGHAAALEAAGATAVAASMAALPSVIAQL